MIAKRYAIQELSSQISTLAVRLKLPGRLRESSSPLVTVRHGEKTPWAAPSAELLRLALRELPNDQGHFDGRDQWQAVGHAVKGAALAAGVEAEGREAWIEWSAAWSGGGDPANADHFWDGCSSPSTGWGTLMAHLERTNPTGAQRVKNELARQVFAQEAATNIASLSSSALAPVAPFTPASIPPRQWLYGRLLIKGFVSLLVAPGGAGKSALAMLDAVAMATGRALWHGATPIRPLCVWMHNAEDPADEQQRRLIAAMKHHAVNFQEVGNRLVLTSGRDRPIRLARFGKEGAEPVPGVLDWIVGEAKRLSVDVIVFDPLGAMHGLPENSNEAINVLAGILREIADRTGAAVLLLHHASKVAASDMDTAGSGAARGASALVDAVRVSNQLVRMTPKEAGQFGVPESDRRDYFRLENGKANLSRAAHAAWLRFVPVKLMNGTPEYPMGDEVATVEAWTPPTIAPGTANEIMAAQSALTAVGTAPRSDVRSPQWVGWLIANALQLDAGHHGQRAADRSAAQAAAHSRVRSLLAEWQRGGFLIEVEEPDEQRRPRRVVRVGKPGIDAPATDTE